MPFTRLQDAQTLARKIDTAMNRRDEIGMEMLRELLPEIREMIDEVNASLREVDELLFVGLRDEAIGLNEPEFAKVATLLHLEDKAAWPEVAAFFDGEGIAMPPKLDFETLAALESAHAEVDSLARPLDKFRRLVLERASLGKRLAVLRGLQAADAGKPAWAESIAEHERARLAELPEVVRRMLAAKDAAGIADLYAELVDPDWTVPVPKDLVKATRGADLWARLRDAVPAAEAAATALETGMPAGGEVVDPAVVEALRRARAEWLEASGIVQECLEALADCPSVGPLAREDGLEARFAALAPLVQPPLTLLEGMDADEAAYASHAQAISDLASHLNHSPEVSEESSWLAEADALQRRIGGAIPESLRSQLHEVVTEVRGRSKRRMVVKAGFGVAAVIAVVVVGGLWRGYSLRKQARAKAIASLKACASAAEAGKYDDVPVNVASIAEANRGDHDIGVILSDIESFVAREKDRRASVRDALEKQKKLLDDAEQECERRDAGGAGLDPWPEGLVEAARMWRTARAAGGQAAHRGGGASAPGPIEPSPTSVLDREELGIRDAEKRQEHVERQFSNQSNEVFRQRYGELKDQLGRLSATPDEEDVRGLRGEIEALRDRVQTNKISDSAALLFSQGRTFVPQASIRKLDDLLVELGSRSVTTAGAGREETGGGR